MPAGLVIGASDSNPLSRHSQLIEQVSFECCGILAGLERLRHTSQPSVPQASVNVQVRMRRGNTDRTIFLPVQTRPSGPRTKKARESVPGFRGFSGVHIPYFPVRSAIAHEIVKRINQIKNALFPTGRLKGGVSLSEARFIRHASLSLLYNVVVPHSSCALS
jgi:hypothetical protein